MRLKLFALMFLLGGLASAREVKPRILLVFDTSGSMSYDVVDQHATGGDNSQEYPGDGTSRLFVAKEVISEIVQTTSEVEFGLLRYPQQEGEGINNGEGRSSVNAYEGLEAQPLNYLGTCNGALRPGHVDEPFALAVPFRPDNEMDLLRWLDHHELWPEDPELRAEGPTPLGESLRLADGYFQELMREDPDLRCRRYHVILLTDGAESCLPSHQAATLIEERALALREMRLDLNGELIRPHVRVFVIAFSVTPEVASHLDEVARRGGTAMNPQGEVDLFVGRAQSARDRDGLRLAFARVLAEAIPQERCDGLDNDCDGLIDEGVTNSCGQCGPSPQELCNGLDDNCNGLIDETFPSLGDGCDAGTHNCERRGHWICAEDGLGLLCDALPGASQTEACNGLDDDCDGRVDNLLGSEEALNRPCSLDLGICELGVERCEMGRWQPCDGVIPEEERCDALDNDCDGFIDELTRPCGPALEIGNIGQCRLGQESCLEGNWAEGCEGAVGPSEEICDRLDNDCDGEVDEGLYNACGLCGPAPPEICNGTDDNCDGLIDEEAPCPRGYLCFQGACVQPCDPSGECPREQICLQLWPGQRFCHPDPCARAECPPGWICDSAQRGCIDPCLEESCPEELSCELGGCVASSCRHEGCPEGEICLAERCVEDPCFEQECPEEEFCVEGECRRACLALQCGAGFRCERGECVEDPCGGRCLPEQICVEGLCAQDPCAQINCPQGSACEAGECLDDALCIYIHCPPGTRCRAGECDDGTPGVNPDLNAGMPIPDGGLLPLPDAGSEPETDLAPIPDLNRPPRLEVDVGAEPSGTGGGGGGVA